MCVMLSAAGSCDADSEASCTWCSSKVWHLCICSMLPTCLKLATQFVSIHELSEFNVSVASMQLRTKMHGSTITRAVSRHTPSNSVSSFMCKLGSCWSWSWEEWAAISRACRIFESLDGQEVSGCIFGSALKSQARLVSMIQHSMSPETCMHIPAWTDCMKTTPHWPLRNDPYDCCAQLWSLPICNHRKDSNYQHNSVRLSTNAGADEACCWFFAWIQHMRSYFWFASFNALPRSLRRWWWALQNYNKPDSKSAPCQSLHFGNGCLHYGNEHILIAVWKMMWCV